MLDAVRSNPEVQRSPPASAPFLSLGEGSLDFEIRAFVASNDLRLPVRHGICLATERALRDNGIEIPFPQRDVHIRDLPRPVASGPVGGSGPAALPEQTAPSPPSCIRTMSSTGRSAEAGSRR